jgi:hypothetical protein
MAFFTVLIVALKNSDGKKSKRHKSKTRLCASSIKALYEIDSNSSRTDSAAGFLADILGVAIRRDEIGKLYEMVA